MIHSMKHQLANLIFVFIMLSSPSFAMDWNAVLEESKGQKVYWNAWGGDARTNEFINWVGKQTEIRFGLAIKHVKLTDTSEAVSRVVAEKVAGKDVDGSIDLIWINGPNFLSMKKQGLLFGPFSEQLPNAKFLDLSEGSPNKTDFSEPVEGLESPWRLAKFVLIYDIKKVLNPPMSMLELGQWASENPGRFSHPNPSNFMGATFLKQALLELVPNELAFQLPVENRDEFLFKTKPLWDWYDKLLPNLWRKGASFPDNESIQKQLFVDGALDFAMSFDPAVAAAGIEEGFFSKTTRVLVLKDGTIGNVSFVAIPYNARNKAGAMVIANFLLEPEVQAHMQNIEVLGSFTVLDPGKLDIKSKMFFDKLPTSPALPNKAELGSTLLEPHASWMTFIKKEWAERYTR